MNYLKIGLLTMFLLAGCAYNQYQSDIAASEYSVVKRHADAGAAYVGEWTAASKIGVRSIKIKGDGRLKVCLAPSSGTNEGKVYLDNGEPAIIMNTGAKVKFLAVDKEFLMLDIYGQQEKYYAGLVPVECVSAFKNFE